jgi:hypothetical protein
MPWELMILGDIDVMPRTYIVVPPDGIAWLSP